MKYSPFIICLLLVVNIFMVSVFKKNKNSNNTKEKMIERVSSENVVLNDFYQQLLSHKKMYFEGYSSAEELRILIIIPDSSCRACVNSIAEEINKGVQSAHSIVISTHSSYYNLFNIDHKLLNKNKDYLERALIQFTFINPLILMVSSNGSIISYYETESIRPDEIIHRINILSRLTTNSN